MLEDQELFNDPTEDLLEHALLNFALFRTCNWFNSAGGPDFPVNQTLSNIYGRNSASPEAPDHVDETQYIHINQTS
ncbi:hypothetical protein WN51_07581 [Melipona quadrifasciata]|uniref:Uncharacterized protein n=1 Tax=Melipona quadrifasciata TaxID=166423 RepID=A0A0M9A7C2_9HYME|nr:hypothetical protein WN51_07581 [Melipona quadrifasciata]